MSKRNLTDTYIHIFTYLVAKYLSKNILEFLNLWSIVKCCLTVLQLLLSDRRGEFVFCFKVIKVPCMLVL